MFIRVLHSTILLYALGIRFAVAFKLHNTIIDNSQQSVIATNHSNQRYRALCEYTYYAPIGKYYLLACVAELHYNVYIITLLVVREPIMKRAYFVCV